MKSEVVFTAVIDSSQVEAFKAFSKAMKVKPNVEKPTKKKNDKKEKFFKSFKRALNDVKLIQKGKLKTRPIQELFNEL